MRRRQVIGCLTTAVMSLASCVSPETPSEATDIPPTQQTATEGQQSESTTDTVAADNRHLQAFQTDVSSAVTEIDSLQFEEPLVSLNYRTEKQQYQRLSDQISVISGFYYKQVRDGWSTTRLQAQAEIEGGQMFTWYARAIWYSQYEAGEISADELSIKVLDTVQKQTR